MGDGAPAHRTKVMQWPGKSPDLNPIKKAWNHLKYKVQERKPSDTKGSSDGVVGSHGRRIFPGVG